VQATAAYLNTASEPVKEYSGEQFEDHEIALRYLRKFFGLGSFS
jgi:hypothetical protein